MSVKVDRQISVTVQVSGPITEVKQRRRVVFYEPNVLRVTVNEQTDGSWRAYAVYVSGWHVNSQTRHLGSIRHEEALGSRHEPMPAWVRERLLKSDIPVEVRQAVSWLCWIDHTKITAPVEDS